MIVDPLESQTKFGISIERNHTEYSELDFIYKYFKDGILDFFLEEKMDSFNEIITDLSKPELRPYLFPSNGREWSARNFERKFSSKGLTLYLAINPVYELNSRTSMLNLNRNIVGFDPSNAIVPLLRDRLFSLGFSANIFKFDSNIVIKETNKVKLTELANRFYNKAHLGKWFTLTNNINIRHYINPQLISIIKLIYKDLSLIDFNQRLSEISNGGFIEEIDSTTGNVKYAVTINTRVLAKIESISLDNTSLTVSFSVEVMLPDKFWFTSVYTAEELLESVVTNVTLTEASTLSNENEKIKYLNFNNKFIFDNLHLFPMFSADQLNLIKEGKLIPIVDLSLLSDEEKKLVGVVGQIEEIEISLDEKLDTSVVDTTILTAPTITTPDNKNWTKIKTILVNNLSKTKTSNSSVTSLQDNEFTITDPIITNLYNSNIEIVSFIIKKQNRRIKFNASLTPEGFIKFTFEKSIKNSLLTVEVYRRDSTTIASTQQ